MFRKLCRFLNNPVQESYENEGAGYNKMHAASESSSNVYSMRKVLCKRANNENNSLFIVVATSRSDLRKAEQFSVPSRVLRVVAQQIVRSQSYKQSLRSRERTDF